MTQNKLAILNSALLVMGAVAFILDHRQNRQFQDELRQRSEQFDELTRKADTLKQQIDELQKRLPP